MDLPTCYRTLGIESGATLRQVHRAYKRLALKHHPDRAPDNPASHKVFIRVTEAYATLKNGFQLSRSSKRGGHCPRCGRLEELFKALNGDRCCVDCLLNRRRRFLPLPRIETLRCIAVMVMQAMSLYCIFAAFSNHAWKYGALALGLSIGALVILAYNVWRADTIER